MKELFHVRDLSGKIVDGPFESKMQAKRRRDEFQGGKINPDQVAPVVERKFFVTFGKNHHTKQQLGKW